MGLNFSLYCFIPEKYIPKESITCKTSLPTKVQPFLLWFPLALSSTVKSFRPKWSDASALTVCEGFKNQLYWNAVHIVYKSPVWCVQFSGVLVHFWSCVIITTINSRTFLSHPKKAPHKSFGGLFYFMCIEFQEESRADSFHPILQMSKDLESLEICIRKLKG